MGRAFNLASLLNGSGLVNLPTKVTGALPDTNAPSGSVIQVVQAVKTDTFSNTTGSWVNITGLNVSITPSSTSSKILLLSNVFAHGSGNAFLRFTRDGTVIGVGTQVGNREGVGAGDAYNPDDNRNQTFSMMFLDSPSSSSAVSYWVQTRSEQNTYSIFINAQTTTSSNDYPNRPRYASMLIAMEIAA
jgi:hypothetical protein